MSTSSVKVTRLTIIEEIVKDVFDNFCSICPSCDNFVSIYLSFVTKDHLITSQNTNFC